MFSIAANCSNIATLLHRPQQRPSGGNYFTNAPANRRPPNLYGNRFKNTHSRPGTATRGDRCVFPTFPEVAVELGWVLPPALASPSPRPEGGCDWRSAGIPPVSIGTKAHRGYLEAGLYVRYLPSVSPLLPHTVDCRALHAHKHTHGNNLNVIHAN